MSLLAFDDNSDSYCDLCRLAYYCKDQTGMCWVCDEGGKYKLEKKNGHLVMSSDLSGP